MTARRLRLVGLVIGSALLAACVTPPRAPATVTLDADAQRAFLQQLQAFELSGRIAGAVGKEGFSAQLDLAQRGQRARLGLRSPLGFGSATVEIDGREVQFRSSRGESLSGPAALQALQARLGFEPPLASLRYWLLGVPDPAAPAGAPQSLEEGQSFEQDGWRITTRETLPTQAAPGRLELPRRVTLERAPVRLRVLIERWKL
jgi:outer membrane lipoprotein LolB